MRIKIGETVTASLNVDVLYRCSCCGKVNLFTQEMSGSAYTPTIMGINLDNDLRSSAGESLIEKITAINNKKGVEDFCEAGFDCRCSNCGHAEPWARLNYERFEKTNTISTCAFVISLLFSLISLGAKSISSLNIFFFMVLAISATICIGINAYIAKNNKEIEQQLASLPQESFPLIFPYSKECHEALRKAATEGGTTNDIAYHVWTCKRCGENNSTRYSQCKKCGQYKNKG